MRIFDAVVVGSGFGGAVAACRLAERGRSVCVLERGRLWAREDFPRAEQTNARWWFRPGAAGRAAESGLFDLRRFEGMNVIVAAGVGGGSLVYTNVQKIPPAAAFAGWPRQSRGWPEPISLHSLRPYYERVREMLEPQPIPHPLQRIAAFQASHAAAGRAGGVELPPLAIRWGEGDEERVNRFGASQKSCNLCGQCVFGCDRHAKNTLDLNYLKRAEALGAEIWPLSQVIRLAPREAGRPAAVGYEVSFRRLPDRGKPSAPREEKVFGRSLYLAAGSLGTTELLLRSRDIDRTLPNLSPRLGQGWSANGDFFAGLVGSQIPIVPTVGPSVAAGYAASPGEEFYVLEGAIPAPVVASRKSLLRLANRLVSLQQFFSGKRPGVDPPLAPPRACADEETEELLRNLGVFFLMGRDASQGRLQLDNRGSLELNWDPSKSQQLLSRMRRYLQGLGRAYGG
ncbi:MAG: GMC family oxidoreductase N-terminal domain-containing protein [Terriglobia bacterium]